ncbi:G protein-coupled receptor, rhodopsin-like family and GPCR, rhodopsin-like, 7TM domain-containing protein [Strongyloides ratti]|uniref:G protein-coupled receptor, rhodopsin-like family and GPCR, rhodopsin-like, 7TM domain-containing protein n=1 Tax=Strongyloides ratti TaxID=34506 RepID=A0A090KVW8_STRRB|nr:G protein-coupled receptor, rhodopsin-like family and GPCR, rhodopsin-like, 7TM domain-containing protein [Strongyloides ratti]CEF60021.1 G protein-coupled receptor, rhodopsin-like family and GPCR, rhodopsin-like, 7TM domain-containing protein [Strongyloides ratti]
MNYHSFCSNIISNESVKVYHDLESVKITFKNSVIALCCLGIFGSILNIFTLRSPSLQTVPFMYIRSLALFDLIALSAVLVHFVIISIKHPNAIINFYRSHVEDVFINSFFAAGLYCAVMLSIERYSLITNPYKQRLFKPEKNAILKIFSVLLFAFLLHLPIAWQHSIKYDSMGNYIKGNNQELLCQEPHWMIFTYYKIGREFIRGGCVIVLIALNMIIAGKLKIVQRNREDLVKRCSNVGLVICTNSSFAINGSISEINKKKELSPLIKSFVERKVTTLMFSICLIYALGNLPQMAVMLLQNEQMETQYSFQVFRYIANSMEVLNHCLNFYIFCMASSEFKRAFLNHCLGIKELLKKFPLCRSFFKTQCYINSTTNIPDIVTTSPDIRIGYVKEDCKLIDESSCQLTIKSEQEKNDEVKNIIIYSKTDHYNKNNQENCL